MKQIKQFVVGVAVGIAVFGLFDSLLGLIGMMLVVGIAYWMMRQVEDQKVR